jgi:hypothetical protein
VCVCVEIPAPRQGRAIPPPQRLHARLSHGASRDEIEQNVQFRFFCVANVVSLPLWKTSGAHVRADQAHTTIVAAKYNRQNRTENPLEMGPGELRLVTYRRGMAFRNLQTHSPLRIAIGCGVWVQSIGPKVIYVIAYIAGIAPNAKYVRRLQICNTLMCLNTFRVPRCPTQSYYGQGYG